MSAANSRDLVDGQQNSSQLSSSRPVGVWFTATNRALATGSSSRSWSSRTTAVAALMTGGRVRVSCRALFGGSPGARMSLVSGRTRAAFGRSSAICNRKPVLAVFRFDRSPMRFDQVVDTPVDVVMGTRPSVPRRAEAVHRLDPGLQPEVPDDGDSRRGACAPSAGQWPDERLRRPLDLLTSEAGAGASTTLGIPYVSTMTATTHPDSLAAG